MVFKKDIIIYKAFFISRLVLEKNNLAQSMKRPPSSIIKDMHAMWQAGRRTLQARVCMSTNSVSIFCLKSRIELKHLANF